MIVACHVCMSNMLNNSTVIDNMIVSIMTGGSALFLFISGFFFYYVFYPRFNHQQFMLKKIKNVFMPYALITTAMFSVYVVAQQFGASLQSTTSLSAADMGSGWVDMLMRYGEYIVFGQISGPYWYIPFIMIIFAISPVFIAYIKLTLNVRLLINALMILVSIYIFRADSNRYIIHNILYFSPFYLFGINYAMHKAAVDVHINYNRWLFAIIVVLLSYDQVVHAGVVGHFLKGDFLTFAGFDISFIQKMFLGLFLLSLCAKLEYKQLPVLKLVASASFAIFFIHPFVIRVFEKLHFGQLIPHQTPYFISVLLLTVLTAATSLVIAFVVRQMFKSKSQLLIGW